MPHRARTTTTIPAPMLMNAVLERFKSAKIEGDIFAGAKVGENRVAQSLDSLRRATMTMTCGRKSLGVMR